MYCWLFSLSPSFRTVDQAKLHLFMGNYDENDSEFGDDSPWIDVNGEIYVKCRPYGSYVVVPSFTNATHHFLLSGVCYWFVLSSRVLKSQLTTLRRVKCTAAWVMYHREQRTKHKSVMKLIYVTTWRIIIDHYFGKELEPISVS